MNKIKNLLLVSLLVLFIVIPSTAELVKHKDIKPFIPSIMAMGNGFTAQAHGLYSLWTNPAGILSTENYVQHDVNSTEITAFSITVHSQPYPTDVYDMIMNFGNILDDPASKEVDEAINQLYLSGIRGGFSLYGGFVHQFNYWGGIASALSTTTESYAYTLGSLFTSQIEVVNQTELMFGYAYPFRFETLKINIGAAVRPLFRSSNSLDSRTILEIMTSNGNLDVLAEGLVGLHGWGIGFDVGVQLQWQNILFGIDVRDIYTPLFYSDANLVDYFTFNGFNSVSDNFYMIPLSFDIGVGYRWVPSGRIGNILNALIYFQIKDPIGNTNIYPLRTPDFATYIHMGVELIVLPPFFNIQFGFNQGYPTFGLGANLWTFDINLVIYVQEEGLKIRDRTSPGMGLEFAFRW